MSPHLATREAVRHLRSMLPPRFLALCIRSATLTLCVFSCAFSAWSATPTAEPADIAEYRTVATAITTQPSPERAGAEGLAGYLGVTLSLDPAGRLIVGEVAPDSPAA